jgi:excisionase family DNA binding protein
VVDKLEGVARKLTERGEADLAHEIDVVIAALRKNGVSENPDELLTTGQAAELLGIRAPFTIRRWAREGLLDGFQRGGRILVTRESVERMLNSSEVTEERELEADLLAMDIGDQKVPPMHWSGRKPWEADATVQS